MVGNIYGGQCLWWAASRAGSIRGGQHPSRLMQPQTGDTAEGHREPELSGEGQRGCPGVGVHGGSLLWESRGRGAEGDARGAPAPSCQGALALPVELVTALFVVTMISAGLQLSSA